MYCHLISTPVVKLFHFVQWINDALRRDEAVLLSYTCKSVAVTGPPCMIEIHDVFSWMARALASAERLSQLSYWYHWSNRSLLRQQTQIVSPYYSHWQIPKPVLLDLQVLHIPRGWVDLKHDSPLKQLRYYCLRAANCTEVTMCHQLPGSRWRSLWSLHPNRK